MKNNEINIRDPFVLVENGKYYMYGTRCELPRGFDVYVGTDLQEWSAPQNVFTPPEGFWGDRDFWAPEVHKYNGKYYMFASFKSDTCCRGTQILVADRPTGPFVLHSDEPITPADWECLDGTFYLNKNKIPYMVFCHEWLQIQDGEVCAVRLSDDLKHSAGAPFTLFKASEAPCAVSWQNSYITDGPFMYKTAEGELLMLWSSHGPQNYCQLIAYSDNGEIDGKWLHKNEALFLDNGGHGMLFRTLQNELYYTLHVPNIAKHERPAFFPAQETDGTIHLEK